MSEELFEKQLASEKIFDGTIVHLRKDTVLLPNGKTSEREVVSHRGGAAVLAVKDGKILLVRQFRYAYGEVTIEIPAGKIDALEGAERTAIRELEEETGLIALKVEPMYVIYPTPGYTNEKLYIYYADAFKSGRVHLDDNEFLNSFWVTIDEAIKMIENGEIKDAKTVIAIQFYALKIK